MGVMKITTWNVNGLRAVLGRNGLEPVLRLAPDVLCLQEIKARSEQVSNSAGEVFRDFHVYWHPAEKPGYSGVASLMRRQPELIQYGLGRPDFDREGRVICTRQDGFLLYNIYFPNGQRDYGRLSYKLDFYGHLLDLCDRLHAEGEQIVLCGDFNTAHQEIDLKNPRQNMTTSGFLPEERAWIDRYLEHGFVDAYRALYPTRIEYTWWTYIGKARERNTGWRLDYFLVSKSLIPQVQDVVIHTEIPGSDHCPVTLILD